MGMNIPFSKLTFASDRDGHEQIYRLDADGQNAVNLSNGSANEFAVAWRPAFG